MSFEHWTRKYLFRLQVGQFLQRAADWMAVFFLSFGTLVLISKLMFPMLWPHVMWLVLGAIPVAVVAWQVSQREAFTMTESVAYLDKKLNAGGLLMTLSEAPDAEWQAHLPQIEARWKNSLPHYRPFRFTKLVGIPLLFCIACGFVPLREESVLEALNKQTVAEQNVEELKAMMEKLKEEEILKDEEQEQLEEELQNLLTEKNEPLTHEKWETVDALRQKMQLRLDQTAMTIAKAQNAAATLAKSGDGDGLTPEQVASLQQQIAEGLQALSQKGAGKLGEGKLGEAKLGANGELKLPSDPQARQEMLEKLQELLEQESQKLSELRSQCKGGNCKDGQCAGYSLAEMLANCEKPGKGGVTRGRADAELNYGHETDDQGVKFKETILPKGFLDDPKDEILNITLAPPKEEIAESAPRSAARSSDPSTGKATWNRKLSPRHRQVVKGYFNSGESE
ncbi:MAG TPA: hypothetical protein VLA12_23305 [Planctomycetaceae bacterium]|nr:hypothetical protein [Planctomycetaceae bacterium]